MIRSSAEGRAASPYVRRPVTQREMLIRVLWAAVVFVAAFVLDRLLLYMEARRWINYRRRGLSRPGTAYHSLLLQDIFSPGARALLDARYVLREEVDDDGDPPVDPALLRQEIAPAAGRGPASPA